MITNGPAPVYNRVDESDPVYHQVLKVGIFREITVVRESDSHIHTALDAQAT